MKFTDHLKGSNTSERYLEVAFGKHVIAGDLAKSIVVGADPNHVVTIQQMLGEGYGKGWKGPIALWYAGVNLRPASKYKFYPGIYAPSPFLQTFTADSGTDVITCTSHGLSNGDMVIFVPGTLPAPLLGGQIYWVRDATANTFKVAATETGAAIDLTSNGSGTLQFFENNSTQGIDPVFNFDTPHSNTAWIRVELPSGSEVGIPSADTENEPPTGLAGIYECQLGDIYDEEGAVVDTDQYLTNPADVIAFGCRIIRGYPLARVNWPSIVALRDICDQEVTPDYTTLPQGVGLTGRYYSGTAFNTLVSKRVDPVVQYDESSGAPEVGLSGTSFSVRWEGKIRFRHSETVTIYLTHNDGGRVWINNLTTPIIDEWATTGVHSATFVAVADQYYDIKVEWNNAAGNSQLMLEWESTSQPRQVIPQDRLYPKNEPRKRFECHVAFLRPSTFEEFLRSVLFTCNGTYQDVDGQLTFLCLDEVEPSFEFNPQNTVKNSLKFYPRYSQQEILDLPNRYVAVGRDLDSRYLEMFDPQLEFDIPELQEEAGRVIEDAVNVGNTSRPQALANLKHYARLKTAPNVCELLGQHQTFQVLPGDVVSVTDVELGWVSKTFLVLEAIDLQIDSGPGNRSFKMIEWGHVNVALASSGSVVTSNAESAGKREELIDGNRTSNDSFLQINGTGGQWIEIDFGTARTISEINLITQNTADNTPTLTTDAGFFGDLDFDVFYWNGTSWTLIRNYSGDTLQWKQILFTAVTTTKIRFEFNSVGGGAFYGREIEALGF